MSRARLIDLGLMLGAFVVARCSPNCWAPTPAPRWRSGQIAFAATLVFVLLRR